MFIKITKPLFIDKYHSAQLLFFSIFAFQKIKQMLYGNE
jgi:hypothetical protein